MNSPIVQFAKWTVPAVAFVLSFFWYKRRRIDRAELQWDDTGGDLHHKEKAVLDDTKEVDMSCNNSDIQEKSSNQSLNGCCHMPRENSSRVPRKVSESVDIPIKRSTSQSSFCSDSQMRCMETDTMFKLDVQLGSNPSTSYFEMIARSQNVPCESDRTVVDNTEEVVQVVDKKEQVLHCETESQKYLADEYHEEEQQVEVHTIKAEGQEADERDSANHSPVSGVLEGSITDEARSEGSNTDSGKGGSINGCRKDNTVSSIYDFAIPQHLVGRLIGRHGSFLQSIRTKADVSIYVNDHPCDGDHKICSIRGSVERINVALKLIRQKFPEKKFPEVTLEEISTIPEVNEEIPCTIPLIRSLSLIGSVSNDVYVSHIVKPNWLFVQLSTHPSFHLLESLEENMTCWYNSTELPLSDVLNKGDYVAVHWNDRWVRGYIEKLDPSGEKNIVRLVDHGGYWALNNAQFKPLMMDYLSLPFQAIEVFIAYIQPKNGEWTTEAYNSAYFLCKSNGIGQAVIEYHINDNIYTNIYFTVQNYGLISLAEELLLKGHAEQVPGEHTKLETLESICT
ncbi:KH domain-containing protein akap-1 isoform X2 [Nylanderia fulva]|uniref:KH domain-containing protein akap-1 isoform X2 n=1 Tax=Nylanderia fulva TaxID=613905 RepID=UPI0010FBA006|nr:KH domain-containing protein akap-1 isoform X2 [Nylanderia fulva]